MADFTFDGHEVTTDLMASVAQLLDTNGIPNVAWGSFALTVYGVPLVISDYSFVIPDEHIEKAREVLLAAKFPPCPLGDACPRVHPLHIPIPHAHFDIDQKGEPKGWFAVELHKKSHLLWAMPDIPLGAPALDDPNYMLVTDDRLLEYDPRDSMGRVASTHHPVKVPTVARYAEAVALLYYRDEGLKSTLHGADWLYDQAYIAKNYLLELDDLEPRIRHHYQLWRSHVNFQERGGKKVIEDFMPKLKKSSERPRKIQR